jgi:hypothetical protein
VKSNNGSSRAPSTSARLRSQAFCDRQTHDCERGIFVDALRDRHRVGRSIVERVNRQTDRLDAAIEAGIVGLEGKRVRPKSA